MTTMIDSRVWKINISKVSVNKRFHRTHFVVTAD